MLDRGHHPEPDGLFIQMKEVDYYVAYVDGMCEPINPGGNIGVGAFILNKKRERIFTHSKYIKAGELGGVTSNNIAEYMGIISVLEYMIANNWQNENIVICGDAKLSIMQMRGEWNANGGLYLPYYHKAKELKKAFTNIKFEWVPREKNSIADELSKCEAIRNGCEFRIQKK